MNDRPLLPLLCSACGKQLGLSRSKITGAVFCNKLCSQTAPMRQQKHSARNDLIVEAYKNGDTMTKIGVRFHLSRTRIMQILQDRDILKRNP